MKLIQEKLLDKGVIGYEEMPGDTFIYLDVEHNDHSATCMKPTQVAGFIIRDGRVIEVFDIMVAEFMDSNKFENHSRVKKVLKDTGIVHQLHGMFKNILTDTGRNIWVGQGIRMDISLLNQVNPTLDISGGRANNIALDLAEYWNGSLVANIKHLALDELTPIFLQSLVGEGRGFSPHNALYDSALSYLALQRILYPEKSNSEILNRKLLGEDMVISISEVKNNLLKKVNSENSNYVNSLSKLIEGRYGKLMESEYFRSDCIHIGGRTVKNDAVKVLEEHLLDNITYLQFICAINLLNKNDLYKDNCITNTYRYTAKTQIGNKTVGDLTTGLYNIHRTTGFLLNGKLPDKNAVINVNRKIEITRFTKGLTHDVKRQLEPNEMIRLNPDIPSFINLTKVNPSSSMVKVLDFLKDLVISRQTDKPSTKILSTAIVGYLENEFREDAFPYYGNIGVYGQIDQYEDEIYRSLLETLKGKHTFNDFIEMLKGNLLVKVIKDSNTENQDRIHPDYFIIKDYINREFYLIEECTNLNQVLYMIDLVTGNRKCELSINKYRRELYSQKFKGSDIYEIYL